MKKITYIFTLLFISQGLFAATNYVSLSGNHIPPFANWLDAATNIQAAVNIANSNNLVLVNDGTYYPIKQIYVTNNITVKSVSDANNTIVDGGFPTQTNRCFYLTGHSKIDGLTITNGSSHNNEYHPYDEGGGIIASTGVYTIIQNCIIVANYGRRGGGVYGGFLKNCSIINNRADSVGGGGGEIIATNCIISGNKAFATNSACSAGGVYLSTIYNSIIANNTADIAGGSLASTIYNSYIVSNYATFAGGGIYGGPLYNCLISQNSASKGGGVCVGANVGKTLDFINCTIVDNSADNFGGVIDDGWDSKVCLKNSIVYNNFATNDSPNYNPDTCFFEYSCSFPLPSGTGNISSLPGFVDYNAGNYNLSQLSDCINAGSNVFVVGTKDLNNNLRIIDDIVDMGAYECLPEPGSLIIYYLLFIIYKCRSSVSIEKK